MASKRKPKKKQTKKKAVSKKKPAKKKLSKKKAPPKKMAKRKAASKQATTRKKAKAPKKSRGKRQRSYPLAFAQPRPGASSGGQSGDLQGLSGIEGADSDSVNELIEEGNAFEADVVQGVTDAGDADEREVHTHEVPEDDVPGEYLDKD